MTQDALPEPDQSPKPLPPIQSDDIDITVDDNDGAAIGTMSGGNIYQIRADTVSLGNGALQAQTRKRKPLPPDLPYLPNREPQETQLYTFIRDVYQPHGAKPLIIVMHGDANQCDLKFIERLWERTLPPALAMRCGQTPQAIKFNPILLNWPDMKLPDANKLDKIADRIAMSLSRELFNAPYHSLKEINQTLAAHIEIPMIYTRLSPSAWKASRVKVLEKLMQFWTEYWPELSPTQELVVCISVEYLEPTREATKKFTLQWLLNLLWPWKKVSQSRQLAMLNRSIREEIETTAMKLAASDRACGLVLECLSNVECHHVESWASRDAINWVGDDNVQELVNQIKDMYRALEPADSLPMKELSQRLRELLLHFA